MFVEELGGDMKEKKMTPGEVAGHLRAGARLFKSFEFANEAAELVATAEKQANQLKKEIKQLEEEKASLNKECDRVVVKANEAEAAILIHQRVVKEAGDIASKKASEARERVRDKANTMIAEAEDIVRGILSAVEEANLTRTRAISAKDKAKKELVKIEKQVASAKADFMKAFG